MNRLLLCGVQIQAEEILVHPAKGGLADVTNLPTDLTFYIRIGFFPQLVFEFTDRFQKVYPPPSPNTTYGTNEHNPGQLSTEDSGRV